MTITIQEARETMNHIINDLNGPYLTPANPQDPTAPINLNDVVIPGDTWTSGKILPVPENDRMVADEFLAILSGSESISIEIFWFDMNEWRDADDNIITVSAWRRIPMDWIDEAVRLGDL